MSLRSISTSWNNHIYIKYTLYEWYDNSNFVVHQMGALMAVYSQDNLQNDFYKKRKITNIKPKHIQFWLLSYKN